MRARADQALDALRDDLTRAEALGVSERGAALRARVATRAGRRARRSRCARRAAAAARATWQVQAAQDRMFAAADDLAALTGVVMAGTAMRHPDTAGALVLARLLGDLREYTGRLGALFVAPLVRNEALDNDRLARILQMRGRIVQLRALIAGAIAPTLDDAMLSNDPG